MFGCLYKSILHGVGRANKISDLQSPKLFQILQNNPSPSVLYLKSNSFSTTTSNHHSFTVSYLINNCGLSPESALSASKKVNFETPDHPDSIIALLNSHGFSKTQISTIIKKRPAILASKAEKTILPKLAFFYSKGVTTSDLTKLFSKYPNIFGTSLENQIVPSFNFLRNMLLSNEDTLNVLLLFPRIISYDCNAYILPNSNVLRNNGVPENIIVKGLRRVPRTFLSAPLQLQETVEKVKGMGFDPKRYKFLEALFVLCSLQKSTWERKFHTVKKCGWSEEEILKAFRIYPLFMALSEDKIRAVMDFLVNEMWFQASHVSRCPRVLGFSMEKRILPRGLFVQDLLSKGLLKNKIGLHLLFMTSDELFLQRFVHGYGEKASELLKLYNEKLNLAVGGKLSTGKL